MCSEAMCEAISVTPVMLLRSLIFLQKLFSLLLRMNLKRDSTLLNYVKM